MPRYATGMFAMLVMIAWSPDGAAGQGARPGNDYALGENWLCRPGRQDACAVDLATTVVTAAGRLQREGWSADPKAPIDCFYVYPTVSNDTTANSDMVPGPEERNVVLHQFARFGSRCRLYAPLYRQITLTALRAYMAGKPMAMDPVLAYGDVLDAWNHYLQHDNEGRGVVLIGHSQGSGVLMELLRKEIDGRPTQARIVSAMLLGTSLPVPRGKDVGGAFQQMPLCRSAAQTGCVVTYSTFRASVPPPANTMFGRVAGENMVAGCTNPAALGGGRGELHAYLGATANIIAGAGGDPPVWVTPPQPIATTFVSVPGMLTAECVDDAHGSYLAVTIHVDSSGPRARDIAGDVVRGGQVQANWGLHLIDVNIAMGNLVDLVGEQSRAWLSAHGRHR